MDIILLVAADTYNKVPLGSVDVSFISPSNFLECRKITIRLRETRGKLNNMMNNLKQYYMIVNKTRNLIIE